MKSAARLLVYQDNMSWFEVLLLTSNFIVLDYTDLRLQRILVSAEFTLSSSYVKVGFTDITISIVEKFTVFARLMAPIQVFVQTRRPHRSHGYYCAICPFSSGGNIIQTRSCARVDLRPGGFLLY